MVLRSQHSKFKVKALGQKRRETGRSCLTRDLFQAQDRMLDRSDCKPSDGGSFLLLARAVDKCTWAPGRVWDECKRC